MGVPVCSYSLALGQEHVEFAETKIQARIITKTLEDAEIDALACVAVAGEHGEQRQQHEEERGTRGGWRCAHPVAEGGTMRVQELQTWMRLMAWMQPMRY
jgi:hypothetical protein